MDYIESHDMPFIRNFYDEVKESFVGLANGITPKFVADFAGNLVWDHYEFMFLHASADIDRFYSELMPYLGEIFKDESLLSQLVAYQKAIIRKPCEEKSECKTGYDFYNYFKNIYINKYAPPESGSFTTVFTDTNPVYNWDDFGKQVVWYGKMGSKSYKADIEVIKE